MTLDTPHIQVFRERAAQASIALEDAQNQLAQVPNNSKLRKLPVMSGSRP